MVSGLLFIETLHLFYKNIEVELFEKLRIEIQLTPFNSNLQGDNKIVRVNESSSYRG
jgi:hypothetical protein